MALLWLCFTVSGAAALALEMLWARSAGLAIGQTAPTAATVLACYFAGLAGGALLGRDPGSRPVQRRTATSRSALRSAPYGHWRCCGSAPARRDSDGWRPASRSAASRWWRWPYCPRRCAWGRRCQRSAAPSKPRGQAGWRSGLLYALNTFGGVLGIAAAGFGLPALDRCRMSATASSLLTSLLVGTLALVVDRRAPLLRRDAVRPGDARAAGRHVRLVVVAAGAGALAIGLEVLWTRLFAQILHNSVYSFAAVVLVYVLALAAGAALGAAGAAPRCASGTGRRGTARCRRWRPSAGCGCSST